MISVIREASLLHFPALFRIAKLSNVMFRYGRRSNWFKIHCLMQQVNNGNPQIGPNPGTPLPHVMSSTPEVLPITATPATMPMTSSTFSTPPSLWRPLELPNKEPERPANDKRSASPFAPRSLDSMPGPSPSKIRREHASPPFSVEHSLGTHPLTQPPFLPPTLNLPALATLPFHKQALLSPLLASSQMLAAAAVSRNTQPPPYINPSFQAAISTGHSGPRETENEKEQDPSVATLVEQKLLLERFRNYLLHCHSLQDKKPDTSSLIPFPRPLASFFGQATDKDPDISEVGLKLPSHNPGLAQDPSTLPIGEEKQGSENSSTSSSVCSEVIPRLSDTEDEVDNDNDEPDAIKVVDDDEKNEKDRKVKNNNEEKPLDLTRI